MTEVVTLFWLFSKAKCLSANRACDLGHRADSSVFTAEGPLSMNSSALT